MISIWEKETFYAPQDIIIVGSGFVGLWSALYLKKKHPSYKITVLDRGIIPTGASTRNAGFACFGSLSEVVYDAQTMSTDKMLELVEMRYKGLERIQKHFSSSKIDFTLCGGYELYNVNDSISSDELEHNIDYINSLFKPITDKKRTYRMADDAIGSFGFGATKHMVKNKLEGYLHSGKLLQALLQEVVSKRVQILSSISVTATEKRENDILLHTDKQISFSSKQVLLCTNAFTKSLVPDIDIVPARGQVQLTSPIDGLPWDGTFHSDEGFYYFRNLGKRVLLGGARNKAFQDEETTEMTTSEFIQAALEQYLVEVVLPNFTGKYTIEHRWSGIMAMGSEKLPIIKEIQPGIYCAVRMSGMGVALAPIVGEQIAGLIS